MQILLTVSVIKEITSHVDTFLKRSAKGKLWRAPRMPVCPECKRFFLYKKGKFLEYSP